MKALHGRVANVLSERTVVGRAAALHERGDALGALHERASLHASVEVGVLHETAGCNVVNQTLCVVGLGT